MGASERISFHAKLVKNNELLGYRGRIVPVNPNRATVFDVACSPSLSDLDAPADVAVVSVGASRVLDAVESGLAAGIRAFVVNTAGLGEADARGRAAQVRIAQRCREHGAMLIGPNCLGLINLHEPVALYGAEVPYGLPVGGVALIAQSGSATISMMNTGRSFGFSTIVSTGNEAVVSSEDILEKLVEDPATTAIALFTEGLRDGERFRRAVLRAHELNKLVVVLKVGMTEGSRKIVQSHTGALAGHGRVTEAVFRDLGVVLVRDYDELCEVLTLATSARSTTIGSSIGLVAFSGGELSLVADRASDVGLSLAQLSQPTQEQIRTSIGMSPHDSVDNPFDVGAASALSLPLGKRFASAVSAMLQDDDVDTVVVAQDAQHAFNAGQVAFYQEIFENLSAEGATATKPLVLLSNLNADIHPSLAAAPASAGIPILRGTRPALTAIAAIAARNATVGRLASAGVAPGGPSATGAAFDRWVAGLRGAEPAEDELRELLRAYDIDVVPEELCCDKVSAAAAAARWGRVAMKVVSPDIAHKSDVGGVVLDVANPADAERAYESILTRVGEAAPEARINGVLVSPMIGESAAEVVVGGFVDEVHGPVVMLGVGGILVELLDDVAFAMAPVTAEHVQDLLRTIKLGTLLGGVRGRAPLAGTELAGAIARFSRLISDAADSLVSIEINPILVGHDSAVAVDAAAVLKTGCRRAVSRGVEPVRASSTSLVEGCDA
ncbi:acetate--CoA ligase family protein [Pseudonocardia kujensis]|uniref:acetate--CoA ligase family protein n=1 Tax=Pseudonocardia kujensis TaxID=1128675 RepID=UPI001E4D4745|nr:acetate--CoA ligase family protein [Pseudonocardia kujensis]MCE0764953.1 acetate--CoA ligase family protein [Pseudonocardia kujensis]